MAMMWIEGFESFGVTNGNAPVGLMLKYQQASADSLFLVEAGRLQGKSMRFGTGTSYIETIGLANFSTIIIGFGFYQDAFGSAQEILQLWDHGQTQQGTLAVQTAGTFKYYRGTSNTGTLLGTTSSGASASTWCYVEIKVKFSATVGTVDVLVNGSSVLSLTSQNTDLTATGLCQRVRFMGSNNSPDHTGYDDIYILDTTGSVNTTFLGTQTTVVMIQPTGDAGTNAWTPDSGSTHFNRVNENPQDTTTYLEDATSTHKELFTYGSIAGIANVSAVQLNAVAKITDTTVFNLLGSVHSASTDSDDTVKARNRISGPDYVTTSRTLETDPATSAAWTVPAVNSCQFGFKVA